MCTSREASASLNSQSVSSRDSRVPCTGIPTTDTPASRTLRVIMKKLSSESTRRMEHDLMIPHLLVMAQNLSSSGALRSFPALTIINTSPAPSASSRVGVNGPCSTPGILQDKSAMAIHGACEITLTARTTLRGARQGLDDGGELPSYLLQSQSLYILPWFIHLSRSLIFGFAARRHSIERLGTVRAFATNVRPCSDSTSNFHMPQS